MHSFKQRDLLVFFAKMLAFYILWYIVYDINLVPDGRLDVWLSYKLAGHSGNLLSFFGFNPSVHERVIQIAGTQGIQIVNDCNGLSSLGLFAGFVIAFPGFWSRRLWFIPLGLLLIYVANVLRIVGLSMLQYYYPDTFDIAHQLGGTTFFYLLIFILWIIWVNYGGFQQTNLQAKD